MSNCNGEKIEKSISNLIQNLGQLYENWFTLKFVPPNEFIVMEKKVGIGTFTEWSPTVGNEIVVESIFPKLQKKLRNVMFSLQTSTYRESIISNQKSLVIDINIVPFQIEKEFLFVILCKDVTKKVQQEAENKEGLKRLQRALLLEYEMKTAIRKKEFEVYYQPKLHMKANKVNFEALIRWFNPRIGEIEPSEFIPLAEKYKLIEPITSYVFERIVSEYAVLSGTFPNAVVAINLSPDLLTKKEWINSLPSLLNNFGVQPSSFELEITEKFVHANESIKEGMETLISYGFTITLDDFGSKYSSLQYLQEIQCHKVKIDKVFTRNLQTVIEERKIFRKIIDFSHSLNLEVVAEGMESEQQFETLFSYGCDELQGFWIDKPMALTSLLKKATKYSMLIEQRKK
ncbi:EAL domain-containing protein [Bacillus alkalisoli]|uniref:EAL domain-containing protein n=1 Tax=Bacillus alkalisoli TaxID=2011008 RepID=UPI000C241B12|nr:EAL domain-containing protein [Bacillus alkalisoli]